MTQRGDQDIQIGALRDRLSRLSDASLCINESLDLGEVLQGVLDSACSLTGARYALITTLDDSGQEEDFQASGLSAEESKQLWDMPEGPQFFEYLSTISGPLRVADFAEHSESLGLPEFRSPVPVSAFLAVPIRHRGISVGNIHVAKDKPGEEFSREDEETLVMFASQVALVVVNARTHRDEQRARNDLETLIETSPIGVAVFDVSTGAAVSFNQEARRIVDRLRSPDQMTEQLLELITVRRADGGEISLQELPLAEVLGTGETVRAEEIVLAIPDGGSVTVMLDATPIRTEEGAVVSVVVTMQDMTPFEELERLRAEFLGMVSHELRTPLMSIWGSVIAMMNATDDLDPAEIRQFLRIILDQAGNMRDLISDLLDVARIETGTLLVNPEPAELAALVDRARNTFMNAGGRDNLEIDVAADLPLVIVDRRRIVQVIGNLLSNAAKHSPEASTIRVSAMLDGIHVEVSVADEGRGIPSDRLPHLFRKFSLWEDDDPGRNTGLGLAICKGIVEAHGGRIWVKSDASGTGAQFAFTIPVVEATASGPPRPEPGPRPQRRHEGEPILVVDDDPQALRYVRKTLSDAGYKPTVTADPTETLTLVEERRPHLVLLDLMLPGVHGIDLMGDIHSFTDVPVIFISGYGQDRVIAQAFEEGAADYIVKPFSPTELTARVKAALRRKSGPYPFETLAPYVLGDLTIDYGERLVTLAGRKLQLTAMEYQLLFELSVNAGRVLTHDHLLRRLWGSKAPSDLASLRTHLRRLRRKLGEDASNPTYFFAEPRVGYRMAKSDAQAEATS